MSEVVAPNTSQSQRTVRATWYTVLLILWYAWPVFLLQSPHSHPFRVSTKLLTLAFQWGGFYVTYCAILASGATFAEILGPRWHSKEDIRTDLKNAVLLVFMIWTATYFFVTIHRFTPSTIARPATGLQLVVALMIAISAGFTEEVFFRGFLLSQLQVVVRNTTAAVFLQAFLFAAAHGGSQSITQFLKHYFSGCLFAYTSLKRKSLWAAIMGHILLDVLAITLQFLRARRM